MRTFVASLSLVLLSAISVCNAATDNGKITKTRAIAEFGTPEHADGLEHLPYVNPDAPKGGKIVLSDFGSFDTLNFYVLKGDWPSSIGIVYDSLMTGSSDEIDAAYGLIAESVEYPEDKSWAIFNLRPEARFHDGKQITARDFVFALDTLKEHGRPFLKAGYVDVESAEALDDLRLKFTFATRNTMKPIVLAAGMSPLAKHYWEGKDVTRSTLDPPLSSGPYRVKTLEPGRSITYERVKDYWAADLPINRGLYNFDEIRYDYYRDLTIEFEAFKAGEIDFYQERSAKQWSTGYELPEIESGKIIKRSVSNENPRGIGAYFFNLRLPKFQDVRVRRALNLLFDFEAIQRTLLYGFYTRTKSYFPNSDYGASGPPTPEEIAVLEPYRDKLPPEVLTQAFEPPKTDGSGRNRTNKRKALALFKEAGWVLKDSKLVNAESGEQLEVEIMTASPETQRTALPYVENLKGAGIDASIRLVDSSQWRVRVDDTDFDLYTGSLTFFPPPGTLLRSRFGSKYADERGSANGMGIKDPIVDEVLEKLLSATDLPTLKATTRALDRLLLWGDYLVPLYYNDEVWFAHWNKFSAPERKPRYSIGFTSTWWIDPEKTAKLDR